LKDIKTLNLTENKTKDTKYKFICPIMDIPLNGMNKFFINWSCGCVFSKKAFEMIKDLKKCIVCAKGFKKKNFLSLNLT